MNIHTHIIIHLINGQQQHRKIQLGSALAEEIDMRQEIPDVIAISGKGFFAYKLSGEENGETVHHYTPVWGVVLPNHN